MFGYVIPDKPNMFMKDYYRYRAFYCGLCVCTGKKCGQCMRFTTNYDMTFFSLLLHGVLGVEPEFKRQGCILNPVKKKAVAQPDEITETVVDINVLLSHYKLRDDVQDGGNALKSALDKLIVKRHYRKAARRFPELDEYYKEKYALLAELEKAGCDSPDRLADCFASMLRKTAEVATRDKYTEALGNLTYNLGRWVYFADAIDDLEEDARKSCFNPFLVGYEFNDRKTFMADKGEDIKYLLEGAYNLIKKYFKDIPLEYNDGVVTNILWYGLLFRNNQLLSAEGKLPRANI